MQNRHILLIEDNPSDIALTIRAFEKANILNKIVVKEDGQEAVDYLLAQNNYSERDIHDLPALILLDLKLPILDGLDVLKIIRENPITKRCLVVILTSSNEEIDLVKSYDIGVNSYIRKPVDFNQFVNVVKQMGFYWLLINEFPHT